jgi:hypothetical protein
MLTTKDLFSLEKLPLELHGLLDTTYPWEILKCLDEFVSTIQDHRAGQIRYLYVPYRQDWSSCLYRGPSLDW